MVLSKLPVPGRPTTLDNSRARAYCACSRCGRGLSGHFFFRVSFLSSFSRSWETARYRLKYCLKGSLNSHQPINHPTNQPTNHKFIFIYCFVIHFIVLQRNLYTLKYMA